MASPRDDDGPTPGKTLLYALVVGGGLFAGIHWSDPAGALVEGRKTRHVVELIPAAEVSRLTRPPRHRGEKRETPPDEETRAAGSDPRDPDEDDEEDASAATPTRRPHPTVAREIDRGPSEGRKVALTFDAGSGSAPVASILKALRRTGQRCTFFVTGRWAEDHPDLVRAIVSAGHEIGNHTYSHADLTRLSDEQIARELRRTDAAVRAACGKSPSPYFRPPLGARDSRVVRAAAREGYQTVYWTTDSLDSVVKNITPEAIRERITRAARPGSIVLLHCGSQATAAALPALLDDLDHAGLSVATLSDLLGPQ